MVVHTDFSYRLLQGGGKDLTHCAGVFRDLFSSVHALFVWHVIAMTAVQGMQGMAMTSDGPCLLPSPHVIYTLNSLKLRRLYRDYIEEHY